MRFRRILIFISALYGAGFFGIAAAQPTASAQPGLTQLMQSLGAVKSASADFTERKTIAILNAPLVATGTLAYTAPDRMEKTTLSPVPESFNLDGDKITVASGADHQTHVFSTAQAPQIEGLTEGILGTLAGDLPALERVYVVQFSGGMAGWQLVLLPKNNDVKKMITWMAIRGAGNRIQTIDTQSGNGDHSEMSIHETTSNAQ